MFADVGRKYSVNQVVKLNNLKSIKYDGKKLKNITKIIIGNKIQFLYVLNYKKL